MSLPASSDPMKQGETLRKSNMTDIIPRFEDGSSSQFIAWRTNYVRNVHALHVDLYSKMVVMQKTVSQRILDGLCAQMGTTRQSYKDLVLELEKRYGGTERLLAAAFRSIKALKEVRVGSITELEKFISTARKYFKLLEESGLGAEINTVPVQAELARVVPSLYQHEYEAFRRMRGLPDVPTTLIEWAQEKYDVLCAIRRRTSFVYNNETKPPKSRAFVAEVENQGSEVGSDEVEGVESEEEEMDHVVMFIQAPSMDDDKCVFCAGGGGKAHKTIDCVTFEKLPV